MSFGIVIGVLLLLAPFAVLIFMMHRLHGLRFVLEVLGFAVALASPVILGSYLVFGPK